jgi:hypothetical protein
MRDSFNRGKLLMMAIIILTNIVLIILGAKFLLGPAPESVFIFSLTAFILGIVGLILVMVLTSRMKQVAKATIAIILVGSAAWCGKYYWDNNQNIIENYFAVVVLEQKDSDVDVKFAEYHFADQSALERFIHSLPWYMGDENLRERKQMLDFYGSVKAEEKENDKEIIKRYYPSGSAAAPNGSSLLAFVQQYRSGRFAVMTNPIYNISFKAERQDESQE